MSEGFDFRVGEAVQEVWVSGPVRLVLDLGQPSGNGPSLCTTGAGALPGATMNLSRTAW